MADIDEINPTRTQPGELAVKVCGMRQAENVAQVALLAPTLMGFIFYPRSPRYAAGMPPAVVRGLPASIRPVGVFVNAPTEEIVSVCRDYGIETVQLHGGETPEQCRELKAAGLSVFKAVGVDADTSWEELRPYCGDVEMFVLDTKTAAYGGSGKKFDWGMLDDYPFDTPYLLSGGISPDDLGDILAGMRPMMAGVDLNSRFETAPGIKDISKLTKFITTLRKEIKL